MSNFDFAGIDPGAAVYDEQADCIFIDDRNGDIVINKLTGEPVMITFAGPTHPVTRKLDSEAFRKIKARIEALRGRRDRSRKDDEDLATFEVQLRDSITDRALGWPSGIGVTFSKEACVAFFTKFPAFEAQARDFLNSNASFLPPERKGSLPGPGDSSSSAGQEATAGAANETN